MRRGYRARNRRRRWLIVVAVIAAVLVAAGASYWVVGQRSKQNTVSEPTSLKTPTTEHKEQPESASPPVMSADVQPIIDSFVARSSVDYGIEVYDVAANKVIGAHQPDKQYFPASTYKLYVAFLALQRMQTGEFTDTPNYVGSRSLMGCVFYTIETSDSPCGEKLMADITQEAMGRELKQLGLTNSPFPGFKTTAHDANRLLLRIVEGKHLNAENTAFLRKAMNTQVYRNGLPRGFDKAQVYDKVGFNDDINFHDVGIVEFPSGRTYLVSIFTQGQGSSRPHRELAGLLQPALLAIEE